MRITIGFIACFVVLTSYAESSGSLINYGGFKNKTVQLRRWAYLRRTSTLSQCLSVPLLMVIPSSMKSK